MRDGRSDRVVFVAHCLLNQNTRYLGGAACPGVVRGAIAPYLQDGTGLVQLPCPEQRVWGGVLKTRLLWALDHPRVAGMGRFLAPAVTGYLRRRYRRLARAVADDVEDYVASGLQVSGVVGVAGSPTCGVHTTLDLAAAAAALARGPRGPMTAAWFNEAVVLAARRPGAGLFLDALGRELARRHLEVRVLEHEPLTAGPASEGNGALRP